MNGPVVGGVLDVCIGVPGLLPAIAYWETHGFRIGNIGALDAGTAGHLYGVPRALRVVRMWHEDADHGLIRLLQWDVPNGEGLGLAPFKAAGSRWVASEVAQPGRIVAMEMAIVLPQFRQAGPPPGAPALGAALRQPAVAEARPELFEPRGEAAFHWRVTVAGQRSGAVAQWKTRIRGSHVVQELADGHRRSRAGARRAARRLGAGSGRG